MMFRLHAGNNKIKAKSTFSSLETLGFNRPKEAMGSENDGKANMCPCAVKELASKQTDGSISVHYNNLLDITLCMNSMRRLSDVENDALYRRFTGAHLFLRFIRLANTENVFYMSQNHRILIEWEIVEMSLVTKSIKIQTVITATRRRIAGIG